MPSANGTQPANVYRRADLWCFIAKETKGTSEEKRSDAGESSCQSVECLFTDNQEADSMLQFFNWSIPVDNKATTPDSGKIQ